MNIPEEAIEKAARAIDPDAWDKAAYTKGWGSYAGTPHMKLAQDKARTQARAALSAAAPHLMAMALRKAALELGEVRRAGSERYEYGLSYAENYLANFADDLEAL